jgi:hypothetical protein
VGRGEEPKWDFDTTDIVHGNPHKWNDRIYITVNSSKAQCHAALKSRIVAHKTRTNFLLKFVRDISTKMTLSFLRASVSVRDFEYKHLD